jgi:hypothetical protein
MSKFEVIVPILIKYSSSKLTLETLPSERLIDQSPVTPKFFKDITSLFGP